MKKLLTILLYLPMLSAAQVTLDGFVYLENQTDHNGIKIIFERTAPSSSTDSVTTDSSGAFTVQLDAGIYNITYSKVGFFNWMLYDQIFYNANTLDTLTLLERTTLLNVPSVFPSIQFAIDVSSDDDTILVAPGTYYENLNLSNKSVFLVSNFFFNNDTSYIASTIIDGNQSDDVVIFGVPPWGDSHSANSILVGFTIKNGNGDGAISIYHASPTLSNLIITENFSSYGTINFNSGFGGGNLLTEANLSNITIVNNYGIGNGVGGIYFGKNNSSSLNNITIVNNTGRGTCYFRPQDSQYLITLTDSKIIGNTSTGNYEGGGITNWSGNAILKNIVIASNTSSGNNNTGGGVVTYNNIYPNSKLIFNNVTITNNHVTTNNTSAGGIFFGTTNNSGSNAILKNSIISSNTGNYGVYVASGNPLINYSDSYNNENGNFYISNQWLGVNVTTNTNGDSCDVYYNIQEDPLFVDIVNGDYNLQATSPCIDAGDANSIYNDPDSTIADMGCFPYFQMISGCTDPAASNYDTAATLDDGSCTYSATCNGDPITGLFIDGIIDDRVTANFDNMNTYDASGNQICRVDQLRIKYREIGTNSWSQKNIGSPTGYDPVTGVCNSTQKTDKIIYNLTPGTTYEWQMKVWYCDQGGTPWVNGPNFTTAGECPNVGNFTAYGANPTKATFTWDASNGIFEFARIKVRVDSISNPQTSDWFNVGGVGVPYGTFTKNKNGLTPGETYKGQARTWCDPNGGAYNALSWTAPPIVWTQPTNRIDGGEAIKNLDIYPNPSRDVFNITFTSEVVQGLRVVVRNVVGEELIVDDLQQFIGEYTKQINLKDNSKGIYLLEIETNEGVINKKLILQ